MMKEKYDCTELEIIRFQTEDVIMTSGWDDKCEGWNPHNPGGSSGEYEGWNPHYAANV